MMNIVYTIGLIAAFISGMFLMLCLVNVKVSKLLEEGEQIMANYDKEVKEHKDK